MKGRPVLGSILRRRRVFSVGDMCAKISQRDLPFPDPHSPTETPHQDPPMHHPTDTISRKTDTVSLIFPHFHVGDSWQHLAPFGGAFARKTGGGCGKWKEGRFWDRPYIGDGIFSVRENRVSRAHSLGEGGIVGAGIRDNRDLCRGAVQRRV